MKKSLIRNYSIFALLLIIVIVSLFFMNKDKAYKDIVRYEGKEYVLLEYNMDIFTYHFNNYNNVYLEEDVIHPIEHDKWDIVYFNGDLFVYEKQVKKATEYYADDKNYDWYITKESNEIEEKYHVDLTKEELDYIYDLESKDKNISIKFEDIKMFGDIVKVSDDNLIKAIIIFIQYEDSWYYKTEIMNDKDEEYIIPIPKSLSDKFFAILDK